MERAGAVTWGGAPATLIGHEVEVGDKLPEVTLVGIDMKPITLSSFYGKVMILCTVPSVDTGVCHKETKRFNEEAAKLGDDVKVITVSMDLPYAQKRWREVNSASNITLLSDYKGAALGNNMGVLIKEPHLLARVVFVIDKDGTIRYRQIVNPTNKEPDYDEVLNEAKRLI